MRLQRFLRSDLVLTDFRAESVEDCLHLVATHLEARGVVTSASEVEAALLERERAHPTVLPPGIAVPHATVAGLAAPVLMFVSAASSISFGEAEGDQIQMLFILLSPRGQEGTHIKALARICRLIHHPGFVEELSVCSDGAAAFAILERVDEGLV